MTNSVAGSPVAPAWPGEARAGCAFTFDLDAETLWMARGVHEPVTLSQGRFGPVDALPRILALLRQHDIRASFFIPAWTAEHYPDAVRAIAEGGHEIGCHGDEHERVIAALRDHLGDSGVEAAWREAVPAAVVAEDEPDSCGGCDSGEERAVRDLPPLEH